MSAISLPSVQAAGRSTHRCQAEHEISWCYSSLTKSLLDVCWSGAESLWFIGELFLQPNYNFPLFSVFSLQSHAGVINPQSSDTSEFLIRSSGINHCLLLLPLPSYILSILEARVSNYIPSPKSKQSPQHTCSTTLWLLLPHCLESQSGSEGCIQHQTLCRV